MQRDKLVAAQRKLRVCLSFITTEFNFINVRREKLDNCADFAAL